MAGSTDAITSDADNGITGGNFDDYGHDRTIPRAMTAFAAIAWYNTIEILVLSIFVFKKHTGLYYWSVMICAISIGVYATGAWLYQNVDSVSKPLSDGLMTAGWVVMIPSQSIVLWSRLHCVTSNRVLLKALLYMIIINSFCLIIPTCVLNWGSLMGDNPRFIRGYSIIEKIQMCIFTTQEIIISSVYLLEVRKVARVMCEQRARSMVIQLILMNVLIILLDIATVAIEFCNLFMIQVTMKGMVYSVKLKVEFAVLSKIIHLVRVSRSASGSAAVEPGSKEEAWDPDRPVGFEKDVSPQVSAAMTSRTNSFEPVNRLRFQSIESTRLQSFDGSIVPSLHQPETPARAGNEDDGRWMRSLQQNVPADWRLSIGHEALSGPNVFEIRQLSQTGIGCDSNESEHDLYPGRLD